MASYSTITTSILPSTRVAFALKEINNNESKCPFPENEMAGYRSLWGWVDSPIKYRNAIVLILLHIWGGHVTLTMPYFTCWRTFVWAYIMGQLAGIGITAGVHRLWTHRSYKATLPFRTLLMLLYILSGMNTIPQWVLDHRVHHKYSETDADPHNANRGFFFAHCGWLMLKKHPHVISKGKEVDMSDVLTDPVVQFAEEHWGLLRVVIHFLIPTLVPMYFWGETFYYAFACGVIQRWVLTLNFVWSVNSVAHIWGYKSYDRRIQPAENAWVAYVASGEGWHNYHHTFPWDYRAAEIGHLLNLTTYVIDAFAKIGWAYQRKSASMELIKRVVEKSGDGSHPLWRPKELCQQDN